MQKKKEAEDLAHEQKQFEEEEIMKEKRKEEAQRLAEKEAEKKKVILAKLIKNEAKSSGYFHKMPTLFILSSIYVICRRRNNLRCTFDDI